MSSFYLGCLLVCVSLSSYQPYIIVQPPNLSVLPLTTRWPPTQLAETLDGKNHECYRECKGVKKTCYYHFTAEWYQSLSKACFDCPFNITDCGRKDCVQANGFSRMIAVVNRKMPGPALEVCHNDRIIVDVTNELMATCTTVHWHGMHQKASPYMDGTPFVTQCPIQADTTFRYEFTADNPGTHFWHSHIGLQRGDGMTGAFIVRRQRSDDPHGKLYDYDLSEHVMLVQDWVDTPAVSMFAEHYHSSGDNRPSTLLINGVGRFTVRDINNRTATTRPARFDVQKGYRYRFRLINAEFLNCPVELSVDGHNITVIASDGADLEPVAVTSLVSYAGERFDFIINANQSVDSYWIRVRGLLDCSDSFTGARQVGILQYKGASSSEPQGTNLTWAALHNDGPQMNSLNQGEEQRVNRTISMLKSLKGPDESLKPIPDHKFYIAYDLYSKNNTHYHKIPEYPVNGVREEFRVYTPQLNHISMKMPTSPLLVSRPSHEVFCNESTIPDYCHKDYCQCSHVLNVKLNSVVELVIIDEGVSFEFNHPFHLHGHNFRVVGQRRLGNSTTVEQVKAFEKSGGMTRNLRNPPIKDTVTVPDGGYTVVRFKADNPGYWLFHCHIEFHAEIGMALVFKVGEHKDMKPVPIGFPSCGANFGQVALKPEKPVVHKVINRKQGKNSMSNKIVK